jgi:hypothetical protein
MSACCCESRKPFEEIAAPMFSTVKASSKLPSYLFGTAFLFFYPLWATAGEDLRQLVQLPDMMRMHMMSNMRDHLAALNEIMLHLANDEPDEAAEVAESRLGMSSLEAHGASHMAHYMPDGMRQAGTNMHKAASRFALTAQEGDILQAYKALSTVTSACVSCHTGYRIR